MFRWLAQRRAMVKEHERVWSLERTIEGDGLSRFQHRAEKVLNRSGFAIRDRTIGQISGGEKSDLFITGIVGTSSSRIYLYQDGIELHRRTTALRLEDWDCEDPDEMIGRLVAGIHELEREAALREMRT